MAATDLRGQGGYQTLAAAKSAGGFKTGVTDEEITSLSPQIDRLSYGLVYDELERY